MIARERARERARAASRPSSSARNPRSRHSRSGSAFVHTYSWLEGKRHVPSLNSNETPGGGREGRRQINDPTSARRARSQTTDQSDRGGAPTIQIRRPPSRTLPSHHSLFRSLSLPKFSPHRSSGLSGRRREERMINRRPTLIPLSSTFRSDRAQCSTLSLKRPNKGSQDTFKNTFNDHGW